MIGLSKDSESLQKAVEPYKDTMGFDCEEWVNEDGNLALTDGKGNWALFTLTSDKVYTGHYFFQARGRDAIKLGRDMLDFFFKETNAPAVRGLTPLTNQKARWMSRQLGFKSHGVLWVVDEYCELFILTRKNNG